MKKNNWFSQIGFLIFIIIAIIHFYYIVTNVVDVPHMDEWNFFFAKYLSTDFSIRWLFSLHNEHRIVLTKLYTILLFHLNRWDISIQIILNFLFFLCLIISLVYVLRKTIQIPLNILWIMCIPLLSPIVYENHLWGFQSQFHFFLFALIWSSYLFLKSLEVRHVNYFYLSGAVISALGVYSFSLGVICAMVVFAVFLYKQYLTKVPFKKLYIRLTIAMIPIVAILLWLIGFHKNPGHPDIIFPWNIRFYTFYINIMSPSFGITGVSLFKSLLSSFFVIGITMHGLRKLRNSSEHRLWVPLTINLSILLSLAFVTIGRAGFDIEQAKSSRYAGISLFLFPTSLSILWILLEDKSFLKIKYHFFLTALVILCFANNFNFSIYREIRRIRIDNLRCIADFLDGRIERANCPNSYIADITEQVKVARDMGVSFTKNYKRIIDSN
ncbi:MAG: hypothetical protein HY096_09500 [Nitrospinae bacterium]|nr:hypothetical protein [Nitrospinota bacterium]